MAKIVKDDIDRWVQYGFSLSTKSMIFPTEVDDEGLETVLKTLHLLDETKPELPITIYMNNYGGDTQCGLGMYDAIQSCSSQVHIKVYGACFSMGAWVLQAADRRLLSKHSRMMIHVGEMGIESSHPEIVRAWVNQEKKDTVLFENIMFDKMREVNPKITRATLRRLLRFDTILEPQDAVRLGLADEVIE